MHEIFVSYKRTNSEAVYALVNEIKDVIRARCWVDVVDLRAGCNYDNKIAKAIKNSKICLFIISKELSSSVMVNEFDYVMREANVADSTCHKTIIPVSIDGTSFNDNPVLSLRFGLHTGYDITNVTQKKSLFEQICKLLNLKPQKELNNYFYQLRKYDVIPNNILDIFLNYEVLYIGKKSLQAMCIKNAVDSLRRDYTKIKCIEFKWEEYTVIMARFPISSSIYSFWELTQKGDTIACGLEQDYVLKKHPNIRASYLKFSSNPHYTTSLVDEWI